MKHFPVYFNGHIPLAEIADALHARGMHLRCDANGRMIVDYVPRLVRQEPVAVPPVMGATMRKVK